MKKLDVSPVVIGLGMIPTKKGADAGIVKKEDRFSEAKLIEYKKKSIQKQHKIAKIRKIPGYYHKKIDLTANMESIREESIDEELYDNIHKEIFDKYGTLGGLADFNRNMLLFETEDMYHENVQKKI